MPAGRTRIGHDGAIALYDSDMEELFKVASTGTPVQYRRLIWPKRTIA